jgi:hypothetical protein
MVNLCQACLGFPGSQVLQRATVYALRPRMPVHSGAGFTAPQASSEPEAWTPRLILPLLMLLVTRTQYRPSDSHD